MWRTSKPGTCERVRPFHPSRPSPEAPRRARGGAAGAGLSPEPLERRALLSAGDLDPTFGGGDGITLTGFGGTEVAYDVALLPGGKIVVGATGGVVRYNPDGSLDRSFGGDGRGEAPHDVTSVAVQSDGRVIAGTSAGLYRFNTDGTRDMTFGGGDGVATPGTSADVLVLPDGRIATGGDLSGSVFDANGNFHANFRAGNLAPETSDVGFGNGGIAFDAEGRILSAGTANTPYNFMDGFYAALAVARFDPDGRVDSSFANGSDNTGPGVRELYSRTATNQTARDIAVGPDGRTVILGRTVRTYDERDGEDYLRVLGADAGATDAAAFDRILDGSDHGHLPTSITIGHDGKLLYVGAANAGTEEEPRYAFGVVRFNRDGSADTTFSGDGVAVTPIGAAASARAAVVQPDGKVILVGGASGDIALVRYQGDGPTDGDDQRAEAYRLSLPWRPLIGRTIDSPTDVDVYRLEVPAAGRRIGFDVDRSSGGSLNAHLALFNAGGSRVASNDDGVAPGETAVAGDPYLEFTFPAAGTYYVAVSSAGNVAYNVSTGAGDAGGSTTGGYSLTLADRTPRAVGDYDFSFGIDGAASGMFPSLQGNGEGTIALHPDGTFVSANAVTNIRDPRYEITTDSLSAVRYRADGLVDGSFGPYAQGIGQPLDGYETEDLWGELALAVPGGRTVVVGQKRSVWDDESESYDAPILLVRYGPTGRLDTAAEGWEGGSLQLAWYGSYDRPTAAALQADGKILVSGTGILDGESDSVVTTADKTDFWVARFLPSGSRDTAFGDDGVVMIDFNGLGDYPSAVAELPGGKILVTGTAGAADGSDFAAARLNADGSPDTTFGGGGGRVTTDFDGAAFANGLALLPGGKFALVGGAQVNDRMAVALARYNADGSLDTTFGTRGIVITPGNGSTAGAAIGDDAGRIVVGVNGYLSRYTTSGALDTTFGVNGFADSPVFAIRQIFLLPDGNWLVSGGGSRARHFSSPFPDVQPPAGPVTYQAESATLSGAKVASNHAGFTGTGFADYVNASGDFVQWTVTVPSAGTYALDFRYANGAASARPLELKVNGVATPAQVGFAPTGAWSTWRTLSTNATLAAGVNRIRLTAVGSSGPNVDAVTVRPPAPQARTLEAEAATLSGPSVKTTNRGFTGAGYADFNNASRDYVEWTFDAPAAGEYDLTFRYANGGTTARPLDLSVHGQPATTRVPFAPTGSWTTWRTVTARVTLAAGQNRIRLTAIGSNGANIDSLTIAPSATA